MKLLNKKTIMSNLSTETAAQVVQFDIQPKTDSTQNDVQKHLNMQPQSGIICMAEEMTQGRGRRGREWISPPYCNIYFSMSWGVSKLPCLSCLGLVVAVAVIRSLESVGVSGCSLKWPNDVLFQGKKLAGILVEIKGSMAIVGVGINVNQSENTMAEVSQPWTTCEEIQGKAICRNKLAASLIENLFSVLDDYERNGFDLLREQWIEHAIGIGQPVSLHVGDEVLKGVFHGVDHQGALQLKINDEIKTFMSGDVSLRYL